MPSRVEREIEEILNKLESPGPGRQPVRLRRTWRSRLRAFTRRIPLPGALVARLNAGTMMLWGIGLILLALVLSRVAPDLTRWAVIAGLVLFFGSFVLGFLHRGGGSAGGSREVYWRGERYNRSDLRGPSTIDRIKTWWRGRNRRR
jgi:hypothetical protein